MHVRVDRRTVVAEAGAAAPGAYRWSILAATIAAAGLATVNLAGLWAASMSPCAVPGCAPPQLTASAAAAFVAQGVALEVFATVSVIVTAIATAVPLLLAPLVAWRGTGPAAVIVPPILLLTALGPAAAFAPAPQVADLLRLASQVSLFALLGSYPGGRFQPRWTAIPVAFAVVWAAVTAIPSISAVIDANVQPWSSVYGVGFAIALAGIVAGLFVRFLRGDAAAKRAILLLAVALGLFVCYGASFSIYQGIDAAHAGIGTVIGAAADLIASLMVAVVLGVIAIAALRDGVYGVRVTVNRMLVGAIALGITIVVFLVAAAVASLLLGGWMPQAIAGAVAALTLLTVFRPIVRGIDRLMYGDADDPDRLAARLAAALAAADDTGRLVPELLEVLADGLRLPWVALDAPAVPDAPPRAATIALDPADPDAAVVTAGLRAGQRRLHRRDRAAIRATAPTLRSALATVRLTQELHASRLRVVAAAERERRSLRRELHDGLGPTLAAARHRITAARVDADDTDPTGNLARAEDQIAEAVQTIRMLARRLRPPALDERGLSGALEAAASDLGLDATVLVDSDRLPDLVEVGLYRIAVEALANVARHAGTTRARVRVTAAHDEVALDIADDGVGVGGAARGVGITAMHERAAELGGRLDVTDGVEGGTLVTARLPVSSGGVE